ncbi:MAG: hypothetical protein WD944_08260 [Steroidobacteraceae bacterium]
MDSSTDSELIVALAWRSAEVAGIGAALLLLMALIVRRYLQYEARPARAGHRGLAAALDAGRDRN